MAKYYNKDVVIRVIRLRYLQQSSDILAKFLAVSLAKRGSNPLRTLRIALQKIRIPKIKSFDNRNFYGTSLLENLISLKNVSSLNVDNLKKMESINELLLNEVLVSTMHKAIVGLRIQIAGRLNRRAIAARAVSKTGQVGSLKNIDSSIKGLSRGLLRGHLRPNIEQASFNGKTRNGAFNVRVLISHYYCTLANSNNGVTKFVFHFGFSDGNHVSMLELAKIKIQNRGGTSRRMYGWVHPPRR